MIAISDKTKRAKRVSITAQYRARATRLNLRTWPSTPWPLTTDGCSKARCATDT